MRAVMPIVVALTVTSWLSGATSQAQAQQSPSPSDGSPSPTNTSQSPDRVPCSRMGGGLGRPRHTVTSTPHVSSASSTSPVARNSDASASRFTLVGAPPPPNPLSGRTPSFTNAQGEARTQSMGQSPQVVSRQPTYFHPRSSFPQPPEPFWPE
jgi:hypothetical protein